jgi:hypothetical protein
VLSKKPNDLFQFVFPFLFGKGSRVLVECLHFFDYEPRV